MTAPLLASRVMKARRTSTCPVCCRAIQVGQQIAKAAGQWQHSQCLIEANRADRERP